MKHTHHLALIVLITISTSLTTDSDSTSLWDSILSSISAMRTQSSVILSSERAYITVHAIIIRKSLYYKIHNDQPERPSFVEGSTSYQYPTVPAVRSMPSSWRQEVGPYSPLAVHWCTVSDDGKNSYEASPRGLDGRSIGFHLSIRVYRHYSFYIWGLMCSFPPTLKGLKTLSHHI